jgi:archaeal flagellin FlaB
MLKRFLRHEKGITGLETAIILIAFVVVAAVFAYTALSAGLFSTQKAQEAVYSGLKEAQSTVELKGGIIVTGGTTGATGNVKQISFVVANALGGEPIDFTQPTAPGTATGLATGTANKVVINYIDGDQTVNNLFWTVNKLGNDSGDYLLSSGEKYEITVGGSDNTTAPGNLINALTPDLTVNKTFSLVMVTPAGAVLTIERTTPAYIDNIMNLR